LSDRLIELQQVHARYHTARMVADRGHRVHTAGYRLQQAMTLALQRRTDLVEARLQQLKLVGPDSVLARGFSFTTDAEGRVLSDAEQVSAGTELVTRLAKGTVRSVAK
jgi:exodeoxyribonuclease VII large subunit